MKTTSNAGRVAATLQQNAFSDYDYHVHVPSGAIPKDGPSAGVAMLTSLTSLITGRPINPLLAMTGEITLRGAVLPVGGVKEKVLAALRAGIKTIILPERNRKDLEDVPKEAAEQLTFHFVKEMSEVLMLALDLRLDVTLPLVADYPTGEPPTPSAKEPKKARGGEGGQNPPQR